MELDELPEAAVTAMESLTGQKMGGEDATEATSPVVNTEPEQETTPEAAPEAPAEPEPAKEQAPEPAAPEVPTERLEEALTVAKRHNIPTKVFEAWMRENPEEMLAWVDARSKHLEKTDEDYKELARLRAAPQVEPTPTPSPGGDNQPRDDDKQSGSASKQEASTAQADQQKAKKLSELFGLSESEAREAVKLLQPQQQESAPDPRLDALQAQLTKQQESMAEVAEFARQQQITAARNQLLPQFPGLADKERAAKVHKTAARLIANEVYGPHQVQEAYEDAAKLEFWSDRESELGAKGPKPSPTDQPSTHQSNAAPAPKTRDRGELSMHFLSQGMSADEAAAKVDRILGGQS